MNYTFLGTEYGGWYVPLQGLNENSIIYAAGVGEDISFDTEIIKALNCDVYAFDPTPRSEIHVNKYHPGDKYHFYPYGIWCKDETLKFFEPEKKEYVSHSILNIQQTEGYFEAECKKISTIMKELNHAHIDYLKLDIEGAEYKVIENILNENINIKYIAVEVHVGTDELEEEKKNMFKALLDNGYHIEIENRHDYIFKKI